MRGGANTRHVDEDEQDRRYTKKHRVKTSHVLESYGRPDRSSKIGMDVWVSAMGPETTFISVAGAPAEDPATRGIDWVPAATCGGRLWTMNHPRSPVNRPAMGLDNRSLSWDPDDNDALDH